MGTGSDNKYHSVRRNAESAPAKFGYNNNSGLFGNNGNHEGIREIKTDNPIKDARELFAIIANGGWKRLKNDSGMEVYVLPDNTYITLRIHTKSGSPAVDININSNPYGSKVKTQKIHFI